MDISFCPHRANVDWSNIQTTPLTKPVTFDVTELHVSDPLREVDDDSQSSSGSEDTESGMSPNA